MRTTSKLENFVCFFYFHYWVFFYLGVGFLANGFPSPFLFLFVRFVDFGSYVLGGSFCRGCG